MNNSAAPYRGLVSSDWNECLAPCGPFDVISYAYPHLEPDLVAVFKQYTANRITLGEAVAKIRRMLPEQITVEQLDGYLDRSFATYRGVSDLIAWCLDQNILFMINTTGMIGYFQRVFAKGLLPRIPVLSAHPMIRLAGSKTDPLLYDLFETRDKADNTEAVARKFGIPDGRIILLGDSGGDGPHFEWGARRDAFLIGSMTKPSLEGYCRAKHIKMDVRFGMNYAEGGEKNLEAEMKFDFMDLAPVMQQAIDMK